MAFDGEGTIYIPLEDFFEFVAKYAPDHRGGEIRYGAPRIHKGAGDLEITYAISTTEVPPEEWSEKPGDAWLAFVGGGSFTRKCHCGDSTAGTTTEDGTAHVSRGACVTPGPAAPQTTPAPSRSEVTGDAPDAEEPCKCGRLRDEHGGPYGEGACEASGCEVFEPAPSAPQTTPAHEYGPGCTSGDCSVCGGWHCLSHVVGNDLSRLAGCPGPRTAPRPLILPQQDAYGEPLRTVAPSAPQTTPGFTLTFAGSGPCPACGGAATGCHRVPTPAVACSGSGAWTPPGERTVYRCAAGHEWPTLGAAGGAA